MYPRAVEIQRCIASSYFFVIVSDVIINMDRSMNVDVYVHTYYAYIYIYILIEYVVYLYNGINHTHNVGYTCVNISRYVYAYRYVCM